MASLKIRIKRKPLLGQFTDIFRQTFPIPKKKIKIPNSYGILTACSSKLFIGLQMLLSSVAHYYDVSVLVLDVGLLPDQIAWCKRQPRVVVKPFKISETSSHMSYVGAWCKPYYMAASPFKHTIWIDADTMVVGDLRDLIEWCHPNAFFTADHTHLQDTTLNLPVLYSYLPIGRLYYHDILPYINSGVFVMHKKRDSALLEDWIYCVEQAFRSKEIADAIACWDQGALKWALHKNDLLYLITPDKKFNFPAKVRHFSFPSTTASVEHWISTAKPLEPCVVLHWMGSPKPWGNWGEALNLDLSAN